MKGELSLTKYHMICVPFSRYSSPLIIFKIITGANQTIYMSL